MFGPLWLMPDGLPCQVQAPAGLVLAFFLPVAQRDAVEVKVGTDQLDEWLQDERSELHAWVRQDDPGRVDLHTVVPENVNIQCPGSVAYAGQISIASEVVFDLLHAVEQIQWAQCGPNQRR